MVEFSSISIDILVLILLYLFLALFGLSMAMMSRYLWKKGLVPKWKLITGLIFPWEEWGVYISNTKKDYGHIGIWFKLMVASFASMILTAVLLAFL